MTEQNPTKTEPGQKPEAKATETETPTPKPSFFQKLTAFGNEVKKAFMRTSIPKKEATGKEDGEPRPQPDPHRPKDGAPAPLPIDPKKPLDFGVKLGLALGRVAARGLLALTVLTGFAKKETHQSANGEPPKATLTVGTLGMKVMKAEINNGDKTTDFDANMPLAQGAKEVVRPVFPEKEQDKFFVENPIEKGVFGKDSKSWLSSHSEKTGSRKQTPQKNPIPDKVISDKLSR